MARAARRTGRPRSTATRQAAERPSLRDFEKLGAFYLGRPYNLERDAPESDLILYDSKDLVTHGVCVGMTGSGKTGLCICLLEEAALDGIPAIAIDPKGDLTNLLLTFPQLRPADFRPWINEDEARQEGVSPDVFAQQQADLWKSGLAAWGQDGSRIERLRSAADFAIYTPGSSAGIPVSILSSFAAPPPALREDAELLGERINTTATSLLTLLGVDADPVRSREHILISSILGTLWRAGQDLDLPGLIQQIQTPSVARVGVLELESFFPSTERFALATRFNNLLASPAFGPWMDGPPLDIARLLHTAHGKPRISIFSIAHLNDRERMFFVSLLLNQVLGWMRGQSGTASLRAILYMDEVFGFFPPVANPPSKTPLLTLLKQSRAFGLGILLATQNPVDLDYKGLSNAGTWFLGRLQTERDKARVLDGLEGAAGESGARFERQAIDRLLSGLGKRIFLLHNVHQDAPTVFETRWAMSYLRGPLTREHIKRLMDPVKAATEPAPPPPGAPQDGTAPSAPAPTPASSGTVARRDAAPDEGIASGGRPSPPVLPPGIPQFFAPPSASPVEGRGRYAPMLFGVAHVQFQDAKLGVELGREMAFVTPVTAGPIAVEWNTAVATDLKPTDLLSDPPPQSSFADLPPAATKTKSYEGWAKDFARWLAQSQKLELLRSRRSGEVSTPGETERDFRVRLQDAVRQRRDEIAERLRAKYAPKIAQLTERIRRAEQAVHREKEQAQQEKVQTAVSIGATIVGAFLGRRRVTTGTIGRATTAARGAGRAYKQAQDVGRAEETLQTHQNQLADIEAQFKSEVDAVEGTAEALAEPLDATVLKPKRTQITVRMVALVWMPR